MKDLKKYFHFIIIVLVALLVIPVAYYFLYALPSYNKEKLDLERQKYEEEQQKVMDTESKKEEQKRLLDLCLSQADLDYFGLWENQCKTWKIQVDDAWKDCRANIYSWQTDESNKEACKISTPDYKVDENGSCLLPTVRSSKVEDDVKARKNECYREYPIMY